MASASIKRRAGFAAAALGTIAFGLLVHLHGTALSPAARDVLGDALWASMIAWWMGALAPAAKPPLRGAAAYAICVAVELSQLLHAPAIDAIRRTRVGHLFLGSGFDPRDLGAYALGVLGAVLLEALLTAKASAK